MPKVCKAPSRLPAEPDYKELETFHRHSMLIEDRVLKATSVSLVEPQYKIMHCQDDIAFQIWCNKVQREKTSVV